MRVTNKMLSDNYLYDMGINLENMQKLQKQMSTLKEINKPSDDPFKVARTMQISTDIAANTQYNSNIEDTSRWLQTSDTALGQLGSDLQRVNELLVAAGSSGYGPNERKAVKDEINEKISEFAQILNDNYDGKYLFGGTRGTAKPVTATQDPTTKNTVLNYCKRDGSVLTGSKSDSPMSTEYSQINSKLTVEVSQGVTMDYSVSATDVLEFKNESGVSIDLRKVFTAITNHLDGNADPNDPAGTDPTKALTTTDMQNIKDAMNSILKIRSSVGAQEIRMDNAQKRNQEQNFNLTDVLSKTEDVDITEKTMEYANMQTVYMASLQTSSKVIQPTLLDYIR